MLEVGFYIHVKHGIGHVASLYPIASIQSGGLVASYTVVGDTKIIKTTFIFCISYITVTIWILTT